MHRLRTFPSNRIVRDFTLVAGFFALVLFAFLLYLDTQMAPYGIVAFEFAFTPARAGAMFAAWGEPGRAVARQSLLADFRFMPAYAVLFAGLTLLTARGLEGEWQSIGLDLTLAPFGAWLFDAVENVALLWVLRAPATPSRLALVVAGFAASIKFLLLLLCLLYLAGALAVKLRARFAPQPAEAEKEVTDGDGEPG